VLCVGRFSKTVLDGSGEPSYVSLRKVRSCRYVWASTGPVGGWVSGSWFALVGPAAIHSAGELFVDKAFIGVDGIHAERGLTTNYPDQATIHRAMVKQARRTIVVADHHKLGIVGMALICPITDIRTLITDRSAPDEALAPFLAAAIEVQRA